MKYVLNIPLEDCGKYHYREFISLFELTDYIKKIVNKEIIIDSSYIISLLDKDWLRGADFYEPQTKYQKEMKKYEEDFTIEDYLNDRIGYISYFLDTMFPENYIFKAYVKILNPDFDIERKIIKQKYEEDTKIA
jgi:hypothetical protein